MSDLTYQYKMFGIKTMLYCPKCRRTYQEGTQRFCTNDGGRLLPSPSNVKSAAESSNGVFSNLLNKTAAKYDSDEQLGSQPRFARNEPPVFASPRIQKMVGKKTTEDLLEITPTQATDGKISNISAVSDSEKPLGRLIQRHEIPSSQAELGDRQKNPTGRLAITWANPNVLLGQTVKGRYYVEEKLSQDESSVSFLASDKILLGKKVVVKILMDDNDKGNFQTKQSSDERVSLSHINHPNIASLFDSGELLEGKPFLITEYVEGKTLRALMQQSGALNPQRVARIIRQIALSLSDAHQNGVLHRGLRPEKVILGVSDVGSEQVKVTDFAGFSDTNIRNQTLEKVSYWSPEQVEGKAPTFASDTYTLAIIAYEMLTGKLPFSFSSAKELLDAQKQVSIGKVNDLPDDVSAIIQKGMAYDPTDRYSRARDFGEVLYGVLNSENQTKVESFADLNNVVKPEPQQVPVVSSTDPNVIKIEAFSDKPKVDESNFLHIAPISGLFEDKSVKTEGETIAVGNTSDGDLWKKRSPEPLKVVNLKWLFLGGILGTLLLLAAVVGVWRYFVNKQGQIPQIVKNKLPDETISQPDNNPETSSTSDVDVPPAQRVITPPDGFKMYQNTKEGMQNTMLKNFRGFSLYYPENWVKIEKKGTNFVDVRKNAPNGIAIEQMVVSSYVSKGIYKEDESEFPKLAAIASKELDKEQGNFKKLDEGMKFINKDRKVYEMRFEGTRKSAQNEPYTIWGRILWIPAQRRGINSGLLVTMIATSYSDVIKSVDDVGVSGDLQKILETFEPDSVDSTN
jgi:serine/threonine protein kinase